jgi:maltooligosyltrehalose synthase
MWKVILTIQAFCKLQYWIFRADDAELRGFFIINFLIGWRVDSFLSDN